MHYFIFITVVAVEATNCSVLCRHWLISFFISNFCPFSIKVHSSPGARWHRTVFRLEKNRFQCSSRLNVGKYSLFFFFFFFSTVALRRAAGSYTGAIKINTHTKHLPADHWPVGKDRWPQATILSCSINPRKDPMWDQCCHHRRQSEEKQPQARSWR